MIIIFWEMTPCGSYKNRRFGGLYRLYLQGARVRAGYRAKLKALVQATTHRRGNLKSYKCRVCFHIKAVCAGVYVYWIILIRLQSSVFLALQKMI
jgi:hypothetical protein